MPITFASDHKRGLPGRRGCFRASLATWSCFRNVSPAPQAPCLRPLAVADGVAHGSTLGVVVVIALRVRERVAVPRPASPRSARSTTGTLATVSITLASRRPSASRRLVVRVHVGAAATRRGCECAGLLPTMVEHPSRARAAEPLPARHAVRVSLVRLRVVHGHRSVSLSVVVRVGGALARSGSTVCSGGAGCCAVSGHAGPREVQAPPSPLTVHCAIHLRRWWRRSTPWRSVSLLRLCQPPGSALLCVWPTTLPWPGLSSCLHCIGS